MNDSPHTVLRDLIRYLEQQRDHGLSFFFDEGPDGLDEAAVAMPPTGEKPRPAPDPSGTAQAPAASSIDERRAEKEARERRFEIECARFVEESLRLLARTKAAFVGHAAFVAEAEPEQPEAVQSSMFVVPQDPVEVMPSVVPSPSVTMSPADRKAALEAIAEEIGSCARCGLHVGRTRSVPGTGSPQADLVLIGEAPGHEEDRQGLPFVGRSGKLLTDILRAVGLDREDVFICNILKCRPPENRDPQPDEAAACATYLSRQLAVIQPKLILCLGRIAAQRLLGTSASLGALRHALHFHEGIPVMATFHPAALLRQPAQKREAWDDIRKVRALFDALST